MSNTHFQEVLTQLESFYLAKFWDSKKKGNAQSLPFLLEKSGGSKAVTWPLPRPRPPAPWLFSQTRPLIFSVSQI